MNLLKLLVVICNIMFVLNLAAQDIAVIVNKQNIATNELDQNTIKKIFLGRLRSFPLDGKAVPVDQSGKLRQQFYQKIADQNMSEWTKYWARLVFTGKASKPQELDNDQEVIRWVENNPEGIGYINSKSLNGNIKKVHQIN